jgi:hypothetical protein
MKNISVNQVIIVFFVGILLFSDFSKICKNLRNLFKNTEISKTLRKK